MPVICAPRRKIVSLTRQQPETDPGKLMDHSLNSILATGRRRGDYPTRREMLLQSGGGFGALALAGLMGSQFGPSVLAGDKPAASITGQHFPAKAKRVIFLFMEGGP